MAAQHYQILAVGWWLFMPWLLLPNGTALAIDDGARVPIHVNEVYVPAGFDDNDDVTVVLDGFLPSSCFSLDSNSAQYDAATRTWSVHQYAIYKDQPCLPSGVPFFYEIHLGRVAEGSYTIQADGPDPETLKVAHAATTNVDDHLYAPIELAFAEYSAETHHYQAVLIGRRTNTCMDLKPENVRIINSGKTIEVMPIIERYDAVGCVNRNDLPMINVRVDLPAGIKFGRHLLHVRSLNGKAVNMMFLADRPN